MTTETQQLARIEPRQPLNLFDPVQFETLQRMCTMFSNSDLVPDMYKVSANNSVSKATANCMIAIEMAHRIDASPLMIMQNMVIIYGRPSWSSKFLVATVNTCGRFDTLKYEFKNLGKVGKIEYVDYDKEWVETPQGPKKGYYKNKAVTKTFDGSALDNIQCIAWTTRKGSEERLESSPVSIEMAIQEGWYTKSGSKWKTMPKQMLMYRTASFWTSAYAPELSMGMRTVEEYEDMGREVIDIEHVEMPVDDKVKEEIKENANKETLQMDADNNTPEPTVTEDKQPAEPQSNVQPSYQPPQTNAPSQTTTQSAPTQQPTQTGRSPRF